MALLFNQDGDYVGEICWGNNNGLITYMHLEHMRNNWVKITRRVENMDLRSSRGSRSR